MTSIRTLSNRRVGALGALAVLVVLVGCREEEQNRTLLYDKGVYLGPADETLTEEQLNQLRSRIQGQSFN